jgi:hypothetical protein
MLAHKKQEGLMWLKWHVKNKRDMYNESQELETEDHMLVIWPSPPQMVLEYVAELEHKAERARKVLAKFDTFTKMTTENTGTERERQEFLSQAMGEFSYLIEMFPEMHPEYKQEDETIDW